MSETTLHVEPVSERPRTVRIMRSSRRRYFSVIVGAFAGIWAAFVAALAAILS